MFAAIGNKVERIHRTRVGPVSLGDLSPGLWRYLTHEEIQKIKG
jgi:16S rRNA pseudouridine516 synthase